MKKFLKIAGLVFLIVLLFAAGIYIGLAVYYKNGFSYGTYINGIYCTGKTSEQVAKELNDSFDADNVIVDIDGKLYSINPADIDYTYDFEEVLSGYLSGQNTFLWIENLTDEKSKQILSPRASFDEEKLKEIVHSFLPEYSEEDKTVTIALKEDGYALYDGKIRVLNADKAYEYIRDCIENGAVNITVDDSCYDSLPYTAEEKELINLYSLVEGVQSRSYTYTMGDDSITLSRRGLADMLKVDENGLPVITLGDKGIELDKNLVYDVLTDELNAFNTYNNHDFVTHDGKEIHLDKGTYGNKVDIKAETKFFIDSFNEGEESFNREPSYTSYYGDPGLNDIGDTYVEVCLTEQKMFFYEKGKCKLETPVVTGKLSTNQGTPTGVYYIYRKQKNATLRGPGYAEPVGYWMPVVRGIGIHDSSWRVEYGGEIYKNGGSHGCINTPKDKVAELYEMVEVGTPVVIHE